MLLSSLKLNALEDAEMEVSVMKGMYVNVRMDFMGLIVKKVTRKVPLIILCILFLFSGNDPSSGATAALWSK